MISTVVVSFNEAEKLQHCLKSVASFTGEKIIIDLESTDNTKEIARKFGAKVYRHQWVEYVELVRNFALQKASGDWILILDPDERVSQSLALKLKEISDKSEVSAVNIPRKNIFFGRWIAYTNWWPDRHIRFFKKDKVVWDEKIHSYPKVQGRIEELPAEESLAIEHYGYDSVKQFFERQNRYSSVEAKNLYERGEQFSYSKFIWKPIRQLLVRFIKHQGYKDGFIGLALTFLMMVYELIVLIKIRELQTRGK